MAKGTDKASLDDLLSDTRTIGVEGVEIVLGIPEHVNRIRLEKMTIDISEAMNDEDRKRNEVPIMLVEMATLAVASTLLVGKSKRPCNDLKLAGQLLAKAEAGNASLNKSELARTALELCGIERKKKEDAQDPPEQVPQTMP